MFPIDVLSFSEFRTMRNHISETLMLKFTNSRIVLIVDLSLYLKTKKLLIVFPLFMTNMLSFLRTRLPKISDRIFVRWIDTSFVESVDDLAMYLFCMVSYGV
jgi:hypothetical protein